MDCLERPIFFVGMPRSGTTVLFEAVAAHPSLGWLSNYSESFPRVPALNVLRRLLDNRWIQARGRKRQYGRVAWGNRYLPQPVEAYAFWDHYTRADFARSSLRDVQADPVSALRVRGAVAKTLRYQGRQRLATKLTGPARIGYLASIFPDALFIHVIRDGRAVVHSLLNVAFWRDKGGFDRPFWRGLLTWEDERAWEDSGRDAGVLAGLQWRAVISLAREEGRRLDNGQYHEVRYEDYASAPSGCVERLWERCGLQGDAGTLKGQRDHPHRSDMNQKFRRGMCAEALDRIERAMAPVLGELGYR